GDVADAGGAGGEAGDEVQQRQAAGALVTVVGEQLAEQDGEGGLEPEHAAGGVVPLLLLLLGRVRGVVGGDRVDGAVGQRGPQRVDVLARADRRVDLEDRVVGGHHGVVQVEVVRGDLGGHPHAAGLGGPDQLDRAPRGDVRDVQPRPDPGGQDQVAGDHDLLG